MSLTNPKVGVLTFADPRDEVYEKQRERVEDFRHSLLNSLRGKVEVIDGGIIRSVEHAVREGENMRKNAECLVLHLPTWTEPILPIGAAIRWGREVFVFGNLWKPGGGEVGVKATSAALDAIGIKNWMGNFDYGDVEKLMQFIRASTASFRLCGKVYGRIGGKSLNIYTASSDDAQLARIFGVLVKDIDQLRLFQVAQEMDEREINHHLSWVESKFAEVGYDGNVLTREKLREQCRYYLALKRIVEDEKLDMVGLRCQTELSDHVVNQCLGVALMNDPYDANGAKEPIVCACESDTDAAITMQVLKELTGGPVLFADFRSISKHEDGYLWTLCNCGAQSTWYAARSGNPDENLGKVHLLPQVQGKAGGAATQYITAPGEMTWARLGRVNGEYVMAMLKGNAVEMPREKLRETTWPWPHVFLKISADPDRLRRLWPSNHAHGVYGDWIEELRIFCEIKGIKPILL